ncbi:MAG: hypothetical protein IJ191_07605 [Treponema sp.]|nr:hypothetical protein [Treponema sp.]
MMCAACGTRSLGNGRTAFAVSLDEVDALITAGRYGDASLRLKQLERRMVTGWDYIGVYRRYMQLGENAPAGRVIEKAFEKNPNNAEIRAVSVHHLMRLGNYDVAMHRAEALQGTRYGSLHAEATLQQIEHSARDGSAVSYLSPNFFPVYYDAYVGSKNTVWLRNAVVVTMLHGSFGQVSSLQPERYLTYTDAYFWMLVQFDRGNIGAAEQALVAARRLYETAPNRERMRVGEAAFAALSSDIYQALSEAQRAEELRRTFLAHDPAAELLPADGELPYIYVNSARWAMDTGDDQRAFDLLTEMVVRWPDFVPGLIAYAHFAWRSSHPRLENETQHALRESGVATLEMQRYDARAKIPVADAIARMDASLERVRDPLLYIARLDIRYKTDARLSAENKIADMWSVLERNTTGVNNYPPLLMEYAVNLLISYGQYDDAWDLFRRYSTARYAFDTSLDFWESVRTHVRRLSLIDAEYAAWFAARDRRGSTARRLYEYCVWESAGRVSDEAVRLIAPDVSTASCLNLGMVYNSLGNRTAALEVYSKAAGRTGDSAQKAEIMYRMARIYAAADDTAAAISAASSACSFDPQHVYARLLYEQLMAR